MARIVDQGDQFSRGVGRPLALHQLVARLGGVLRGTDEPDHLIDVGDRDGEANQNVRTIARFAEPDGRTSKPVVNRWFRRPGDEMFFFAGIWTEWEGDRGTKARPHVGRHKLFGFLTTDPNGLVKPVHEKAMPVVLTTPAAVDQRLHAPMEEALTLQKPAAEDVLQIVAEEEKAA